MKTGAAYRLSDCYTGTAIPIAAGDMVSIDCETRGEVALVIQAFSAESIEYHCTDTGGVLLKLQKSGLTLLPFGTNTRIDLVEAKSTARKLDT